MILTIAFCACNSDQKGKLLFVESAPENGSNYPYYLFIPEGTSLHEKLTLIVEPNNSGFVDDDLKKHIEKAERTASKDYYIGNYVAQKLKYPLLVPVFPRSQTEWKIYTHALDRDVICQKNNPLERIDLQLLAMVEDAKAKLTKAGYSIQPKFFMTGFSASGTFVNRFTLIHPNKVFAVAAGGLNGLLALPLDSIDDQPLNYPLGTNDFKVLFNQEFQKQAFINTPQFYFMGKNDDNDAIPYDDAFSSEERAVIYELLGKEMQPLRWQKCEAVYDRQGVNSLVKTFENIGHEHPENIKDEIIEFFQKSIN